MMTAREICAAMADSFQQELDATRSVYGEYADSGFEEIGVVVVKAKAVEMLVSNLRILRDMLPPEQASDPLVEEARMTFGDVAAAQLSHRRDSKRKH